LPASLRQAFATDWFWWARPEQRPPAGDWRCWVFMGGRGAGKTRAGAEWVSGLARRGQAGRIALIGPTFHDVREVMIEGQSGVRALPGPRPVYEVTRRRLLWANGAQAACLSAEDPESLRGPQFDAAWCDELCFWAYPERALQTLDHALRIGTDPRMLVTTTPRPIKALRELLAAPGTVMTRAGTMDNALNLSPRFIASLEAQTGGSVRRRQEIMGELIEDCVGALWRRGDIELGKLDESYDRFVVAVDPPAGAGVCGIVAAAGRGVGRETEALVLADASIEGAPPLTWANRAAELARSVGAYTIIAEANNGGEMVRSVLQQAAPELLVRLVHASQGKRTRAEPISAAYAQKRVKHAAVFAELEDEMCSFGSAEFRGSPDRLDALVWALTDLVAAPRPSPSVRIL
jgi:phage terminase large subunit-like protein